MNNIDKIASQFSTKKILSVDRLGGGHINQTFLVQTESGSFILQNINTHVFHDPIGLVQNLVKITRHLDNSDYPFIPVRVKPKNDGNLLYNDESKFWRALEYIDKCRSVEKTGNPEIVESVGIAFGELAKSMLTMDPNELVETIPDFHNPEKRFNDFIISVENAESSRKEVAQNPIEHALALSMIVENHKNVITNLPVRVSHNDAKVGNILFDDSLSEVIAIIDMDTMMPGYLMNDFGDMARSMCNPSNEDTSNLQSVYFDVRRFELLSKGFLKILRNKISDKEIYSLLVGVKLIIYTQFIRFLTDFLAGDVYYQTTYPDQNLYRAKVQLKLLLDFQGKEDVLIEIIDRF